MRAWPPDLMKRIEKEKFFMLTLKLYQKGHTRVLAFHLSISQD